MTTQLDVNHGDTLNVTAIGPGCSGTVTINGVSYRDPTHTLLQVVALVHHQQISLDQSGEDQVRQQGVAASLLGSGQMPGSWTVDLTARFQDDDQCTDGSNYVSVLAEYSNPNNPVDPEIELVANVQFTGVVSSGGGASGGGASDGGTSGGGTSDGGTSDGGASGGGTSGP